jgi:malate synthase
VQAGQLLDLRVPGGKITEAGARNNISVALQYLNAWLQGNGAVAIFTLMEDAATAEISRAQLWQWLRHGAQLDEAQPIVDAGVLVDVEAHAVDVERLGAIDVGDWHGHQLQAPVHIGLLSPAVNTRRG